MTRGKKDESLTLDGSLRLMNRLTSFNLINRFAWLGRRRKRTGWMFWCCHSRLDRESRNVDSNPGSPVKLRM